MTGPSESIDWAAVHARLATLGAAASGGAGAAADAAALLAARARALARPAAAVDRDAGAEAAALGVRAAGARWLVPLAHVVQVVRASGATPLPGAERPVTAAMPWRGRVLALLTLADAGRADAGPDAADDARRVLILADGAVTAGLLVDAVGEVEALDPAAVHAGEGAPAAGRFAAGVTGDATAVLDVPALLRAPAGG